MKHIFILVTGFITIACGGQDRVVKSNAPINQSITNEGQISIDIEDLAPGLVCHSGGISIFTFRDKNADAVLDTDESIIKVKSVCNGVDGQNGFSPTMTMEVLASSSSCPQGGVKISSSSDESVEICNGADGLNGVQGVQGVQGLPGMTGATGATGQDGVGISPVQFCPKDDSTFPEYGLLIGKELYAVYWGVTPGSPKSAQAFLTKLVAGDYQSTGGNNCLFSVE